MAVKRASHCVYDTRYHLVWAPKYRKWVLQGAIRQRVKELFQEIAEHHVFEFPTEVRDWGGRGAVQGGQCEGDSGGVSGSAQTAVGWGVLGRWIFRTDGGR